MKASQQLETTSPRMKKGANGFEAAGRKSANQSEALLSPSLATWETEQGLSAGGRGGEYLALAYRFMAPKTPGHSHEDGGSMEFSTFTARRSWLSQNPGEGPLPGTL